MNDLSALAEMMNIGAKLTSTVLEIGIEHTVKTGALDRVRLEVRQVESKDGNLIFTLAKEARLPEEMSQATVLYKTWPKPTNESLVSLGRGPTKAVCCDCSGGCAALWILFGWCKKCLSAEGGEYCCSDIPYACGPRRLMSLKFQK